MIKRTFKELLQETPFNKQMFLETLNELGILGVFCMYLVYILFCLILLPFLPFFLLNEASKEWGNKS